MDIFGAGSLGARAFGEAAAASSGFTAGATLSAVVASGSLQSVLSGFSTGATLGAVVASGSLQSVLSGFSTGATLAAVIASGSLGSTPGTLLTPPLRTNNGTLLASVAMSFVRVYSTAGILLYEQTGGTTDSLGRISLSTAAAPPGTAVRVDWETSAGQRRMPTATMA